ncbi:hypothetical protein C0J52_25384 [Blattella germanica]|nr:hypothetical protein C0J52_25384 [Blattella germanica]
MAAPLKKRVLNENSNFNEHSENSDSSDDASEGNEMEEYTGQEKIQVEFEGRSPTDGDFHGIKQLLQQLFLKAHVNLSELADLIIGQNYQSDVDEDESDEDDDANDVFGITSVVNLTEKQNLECVQQLRTLLLDLCNDYGTDQANTFVRSILSDGLQSIGLLINERIVNIPAQISVPLLESLNKEMKRACEKKMPYDFTYFVVICKLYKTEKPKSKNKKKKQQGGEELEILWSNPEEELIDKEAECRFEFCVKNDSDTGLAGQWLEDDLEMTPYRRVLLLKANKLEPLIEQIKGFVAMQQ